MRNFLKAIALATLLGVTVPAYSQVQIQVAPPRVKIERVRPLPPDRRMVWTPGYYSFNEATQSYDWQPGSWQMPPSRNMSYVAPHYTYNRLTGTYDFTDGHWATRHQLHEEREAELRRER